MLGLQLEAALGNEELSPDELREIVIFLTHYAGWPSGAKMNSQVETLIAKAERAGDVVRRAPGEALEGAARASAPPQQVAAVDEPRRGDLLELGPVALRERVRLARARSRRRCRALAPSSGSTSG